ncbi:MAG: Rrf2 family transcriptional regulator [Candidatus Omnitrophica bacterium]|nr:Rrf2 family transcriptional regulator [Candidatus Omnitrophota bacterium]
MISKKTKYALKALTLLAESGWGKEPELISDLAQRGNIPKKFLELILLELKNDGILQSKKGKGGGYFLAKKPSEIKLGTTLRLLEGPLAPLPCLSKTAYRKCDECEDENTCTLRLVMKEMYEAQSQILDNITLEDMIEKGRAAHVAGMYFI